MITKNMPFLLLMALVTLLSISFAQFDSSVYDTVESGNNAPEKFDPKLYETVEVENSDLQKSVTTIQDPLGIEEQRRFSIENQDSSISETLQFTENVSREFLLVLVFAIIVICLMLVVLFYAIHYYRKKHNHPPHELELEDKEHQKKRF